MSLNPGLMGNPAAATTPTEFAGSMAALIEEAYDQLRRADGARPDLDLTSNSSQARDRRMLFVAIAQGIAQYLAANPGALQVMSGGVPTGDTVQVEIDPTREVPLP